MPESEELNTSSDPSVLSSTAANAASDAASSAFIRDETGPDLDLTSSETVLNQEAPTQGSKKKSKEKPNMLPLVVLRQSPKDGEDWEDITALADDAVQRLTAAMQTYLSKRYAKNFKSLVNSEHTECAGCKIIRRARASEWPEGFEKRRACTKCAQAARPSAILVRHQRVLKFGILPLADPKGVSWGDYENWIRQRV